MDPSASTQAQRNEPPGSAWNAFVSPMSTRCSSTTIHPRPGTGMMARTLSAQRDGNPSESPPHSCGAALNEELLSTNCSKASVSSRKRAGSPPRSGWCCSASLRYARRTSARLDVEQRPRTACGLVAPRGGADAIRPISAPSGHRYRRIELVRNFARDRTPPVREPSTGSYQKLTSRDRRGAAARLPRAEHSPGGSSVKTALRCILARSIAACAARAHAG